eukprot:TRINITY_DN689_c0_g1_i1.p1 TRINITY_DN689_c0_g1~~TRINITY_DN689_c0_g1_i1.p1  ORF type:complete len:213 (-),score=44.55 TRINITY_DN689_c0_g1_i1:44-661(-)
MSSGAALRRLEQIKRHLAPVSSCEDMVASVPASGEAVARELMIRRDKLSSVTKKVIKGADGLKALLGQEIGVSEWFEVTQDRIDAFAAATGDYQWIHVDPERAKAESPFGGPIAHGFLTLSLAPMFVNEVFPKVEGIKAGVNYGLNKLRFVSPVPAGSKLRCRVGLQELTEVGGGMQAVLKLTLEVEGQAKPCAVAEWIIRYFFE